jgi:hypothetical protein
MIDVSLKALEMIETDRPYKPTETRCCLALSSASESCGWGEFLKLSIINF